MTLLSDINAHLKGCQIQQIEYDTPYFKAWIANGPMVIFTIPFEELANADMPLYLKIISWFHVALWNSIDANTGERFNPQQYLPNSGDSYV